MRGLIWGAVFAILSIAIGAMLSHALKSVLNQKELETLSIAAKYLFYVAIPLIMMSLTNFKWGWPNFLYNSFIISAWLFSGSLILFVFTKISWLVYLTPLGGITMMGSWAALLVIGTKKLKT